MIDPAVLAFLDTVTDAVSDLRVALSPPAGPAEALGLYGAEYLSQFRIPPIGAVLVYTTPTDWGWDLTGDGVADIQADYDIWSVYGWPEGTVRVPGGFDRDLDGINDRSFPAGWVQDDLDTVGIPPAGAVRVPYGWDTSGDGFVDIRSTARAAFAVPVGAVHLGSGEFDTDSDATPDITVYYPAAAG